MSRSEPQARVRAPQEDGAVLLQPAWETWPDLARAAETWRTQSDGKLAGLPLAVFAEQARQELGLPCPASDRATEPTGPLIFTGHQPELFHPGVWLKTFVAAATAQAGGGAAINLVIDGDLCRRPAIDVPTGTLGDPRVASVLFDEPTAPVPWEERRLLDVQAWRTFSERVLATGHVLTPTPLLAEEPVGEGSAAGPGLLLGQAFAHRRQHWQREWGVRVHDLWQSQVCDTRSFYQFVLTVLAEMPRFRECHNGALADYRRRRGIRNAAHPAHDLAVDGAWFETPFWIWSDADPRRRPAFVRRTGESLTLSARDGREVTWSAADGGRQGVDALVAARRQNVKLRSRALTTTMYVRLALADLFVHGIGGAAYDQVTDDICRRWLGTTAPAPAIATGTLLLSAAAAVPPPTSLAELTRQQRDLRFHGEQAVETRARAAGRPLTAIERDAVDAKRAAIAAPTEQGAARRHRQLAAANDRLLTLLSDEARASSERRAQAQEAARRRQVLARRDYAACLHSPERLRSFLLDSCRHMAYR